MRIGAFVAATSLMLAGGVALASAASADNNGQGQGADSQTKPKPNANPNNPQKDDPLNPDKGQVNGPSGSNNDAFAPGDKVYVCHADANNGNAANAEATANGGGNNLGQNGGGNTGAGFSIIYISVQAWNANHARLHENDSAHATREAAEAACGGFTPVTWYKCVVPTPPNAILTTTQSVKDGPWSNGTPDGTWTQGTGAGVTCPGGGGGEPATRTAAPSAPLCVVDNGAYNGVTSVSSPLVSVTDEGGNAEAAQVAADKQGEANVNAALNASAKGDNIVPPWSGAYEKFAGYNWNEKTQARFAAGCSPAASVISAVLPGTVGAGKPKPAKAPGAATLPGAVPAGDGSSLPALPLWALAMVVVGAIGAAASGKQLLANRN